MGKYTQSKSGERALLVCALKAEADPFIERLSLVRYRQQDITFYSNGSIDLALTGVGSEKTRGILPLYLDRLSPTCVINAGSCGALDGKARKGMIFRITRVTGIEKSGRMTGELTLTADNEHTFPFANLVSAPKAVLKDRTRMILASIGDCVDMEGFDIVNICAERGVTCALYKIVTDIPGDTNEEDIRKMITSSASELAAAVIPLL
jgi:nucleoside phosphorylase